MIRTINSAIGEAISYPILLLDVCNHVQYANSAAEELLDGRFGLKLEDRQLVVTNLKLHTRFATAVSDLSGGKHEWAALPIPPSAKGPGAVLHLAGPAGGAGEGDSAERLIVAVLIFARTLEGHELLRVRHHFGFSKTEAEVTALIVAGRSPREIAERRRSTEQTVRWHLKNIHAKTYTRRLTELVLQVQNVRSPF